MRGISKSTSLLLSLIRNCSPIVRLHSQYPSVRRSSGVWKSDATFILNPRCFSGRFLLSLPFTTANTNPAIPLHFRILFSLLRCNWCPVFAFYPMEVGSHPPHRSGLYYISRSLRILPSFVCLITRFLTRNNTTGHAIVFPSEIKFRPGAVRSGRARLKRGGGLGINSIDRGVIAEALR